MFWCFFYYTRYYFTDFITCLLPIIPIIIKYSMVCSMFFCEIIKPASTKTIESCLITVVLQTYVWVGVALLLWSLDWMIRWIQRLQQEGKEGAKVARVILLPCKVVQLTLSLRSFTCKPGQVGCSL